MLSNVSKATWAAAALSHQPSVQGAQPYLPSQTSQLQSICIVYHEEQLGFRETFSGWFCALWSLCRGLKGARWSFWRFESKRKVMRHFSYQAAVWRLSSGMNAAWIAHILPCCFINVSTAICSEQMFYCFPCVVLCTRRSREQQSQCLCCTHDLQRHSAVWSCFQAASSREAGRRTD